MSNNDVWRERYEQFLKSPQWKRIREKTIEGNFDSRVVEKNGDVERCYSCDRCGWPFKKDELQVHHLHYHTPWGEENRTDLLVVCRLCHEKEDKKRAARGIERSEEALENARLSAAFHTFLEKKYGEGYEPSDPDWDFELFMRWLESKEQ